MGEAPCECWLTWGQGIQERSTGCTCLPPFHPQSKNKFLEKYVSAPGESVPPTARSRPTR